MYVYAQKSTMFSNKKAYEEHAFMQRTSAILQQCTYIARAHVCMYIHMIHLATHQLFYEYGYCFVAETCFIL